MVDFKLDKDIDIGFTDSGDVSHTGDIETSIITALFSNKEKCWGINDDLEGSYLWKANQARLTHENLLNIKVWSKSALNYLIDAGSCTRIDSDIKVSNSGAIELKLKIAKAGGGVVQESYVL